MEAFKNIYNSKSIGQMAELIKAQYEMQDKSFDEKKFLKEATKGLAQLEMKERVVQIAESLESNLTGNYKANVKLLVKTLADKKNPDRLKDFILWPYTYYIEVHGLNDFDTSLAALKEITKRFTGEWGIRPFFENFPNETYELLHVWTGDKDEHVRRLVSEGTRPNLPWGQKISHLPNNFKKNIQLLEKLKSDESEYVRRSVANHMNDISWYDAELTIKTLKKWNKDKSSEMQWLVKHALRSLLKQGHPEALALIGFNGKAKSEISQVKLSKKSLKEGESFDLNFEIATKEKKQNQFMVDYIIHYPKANGKLSAKTFKLKVVKLKPGESAQVKKKVDFKKVTTRKHYPGKHLLEIQVNGVVKAKTSFVLK